MNFIRRVLSVRPPDPSADAAPARPAPVLVEFLAERGRLERELTALRDAVAAGTAGHREDLAALVGRMDGLTRELGKLGREQFQVTTLLEGQNATLDELAEAWQAHLRQRSQESADLRQALSAVEARARSGIVQDLLPVADALAESIRSARELIARLEADLQAETTPRTSPHRPAWLPIPVRAWLLGTREASGVPVPTISRERAAALSAWLDGLLLVERRLLGLLEREGVRPIPAIGQPFDPHRHLAVAVVPNGNVPDGTIVDEEVRGYTIGDRVLRPAEVVIARRGPGDE